MVLTPGVCSARIRASVVGNTSTPFLGQHLVEVPALAVAQTADGPVVGGILGIPPGRSIPHERKKERTPS